MQFICYPKCTTCQKAKKWLEENGISFDERHIKDNNPTVEELMAWHKQSNLPLKKFFNTSGLQYKALQLKDKLPTMSEDEQLELLASDGMAKAEQSAAEEVLQHQRPAIQGIAAQGQAADHERERAV